MALTETVTPADFAEALLKRLALPVTANNITALIAFQAIEGGDMANSARFNPLNTMYSMPGARDANLKVKGIKAYSSWQEGLEATARTMVQKNMSAIFTALARSAPPDETLKAIQGSPWGWVKNIAIGPATAFQYYADKVYPSHGWLDTGASTLKELFYPKTRGAKIGLAIVGATVLAGIGIAGYALVRTRRQGAS